MKGNIEIGAHFSAEKFVPTWHEFLNSKIMMREADVRVGFFSILEVMESAKVTYRTAAESGFKSHFPAVGTEQKQNEGGEIQGKYISLLSPGNRRNDQFSMDFYRYRVCRFGSLHGLYGDKNRKVGRAAGSRFCSREKRTEGTADVLASIAFGVPNALVGTPEPVCRHRRRKDLWNTEPETFTSVRG